jgi:hypothetical protein
MAAASDQPASPGSLGSPGTPGAPGPRRRAVGPRVSLPAAQRLERLRRYRVWPQRDLSLGFLAQQFKQQVQRPYKQLAGVSEAWQRLVPAPLLMHTRLDGLSRGTLTVIVDSSARLYELDSLLRQGLRTRLIEACRGVSLRRVRLRQEDLS